MANLENKAGKLTWNVAIVNPDGTPTNEFMRKWQAQSQVNGLIPTLSTAAQVSAVLDILGVAHGDVLYRSAAGWVVLTPGPAGDLLVTGGAGANPAWQSISAILDLLGTGQGDTLFRGATGWEVLAPGTNGQVLTYDTTLNAPKWAAGGGGGGGVTIGTGAPTALAPAGTPYSRDDVAGLYVSTPTTTSGTGVAQHLNYIAPNTGVGSLTLAAAPTVGNLVIVFVNWGNNSTAQPTVDTTKWTQFITIPGTGTNLAGFAVYRYVQAGDTASLPAVTTSGSTYWSAQVYEITGVSGTFATDVEYAAGSYVVGSSLTSTSQNTASAGALGLVAGGQYDGNTNPSFSAGWTLDGAANNSSNFGSGASAHQVFSASGSPVQTTITTTGGSYATELFQVIIAGSSPVAIAGWTLVGPAGGGGGDPEFLVPLAAAFPTLAGSSGSPVMTDSALGLGMSSPGNGGTNGWTAVGTKSFAADFTITARLVQGLLTDSNGEYGVIVMDSSTGKFLFAGINQVDAVSIAQYTTPTSQSNLYSHTSNMAGILWVKITWTHSSSTFTFFLSKDGVNWLQLATDNSFLAAPDSIGFAVTANTGLGCPAVGACTYWKVV